MCDKKQKIQDLVIFVCFMFQNYIMLTLLSDVYGKNCGSLILSSHIAFQIRNTIIFAFFITLYVFLSP